MGTLLASLRFIRLGNCAVASATSLAGSWTAGVDWHSDKPWLLAMAVFCIAAFGNGYNDLCDLQADRINRPDRPLVSGALSEVTALRISGWFLAIGLMLAAYAYVKALEIAIMVGIALFLYDKRLKGRPLQGNLVIAATCATTVIFGALPGEWNRQVLVLTVCAASLTLSREIYKDIEDVPGDRAMGAVTLPIAIGDRRAALVALLPLLFTIGFVLYRIFSSVPNWGPAYMLGATVCIGMIWTAGASLFTHTIPAWGRRSLEVKIWVILGVLWVLAWRLPVSNFQL
ncbi:MAG: prenyltransferase [Fibrobacterota bacterium]